MSRLIQRETGRLLVSRIQLGEPVKSSGFSLRANHDNPIPVTSCNPLGPLFQELDLSRDDIVHRADDRDPPFPNEAVERPALCTHLFNDPRHIAAGHGIDKRLLLGRR